MAWLGRKPIAATICFAEGNYNSDCKLYGFIQCTILCRNLSLFFMLDIIIVCIQSAVFLMVSILKF